MARRAASGSELMVAPCRWLTVAPHTTATAPISSRVLSDRFTSSQKYGARRSSNPPTRAKSPRRIASAAPQRYGTSTQSEPPSGCCLDSRTPWCQRSEVPLSLVPRASLSTLGPTAPMPAFASSGSSASSRPAGTRTSSLRKSSSAPRASAAPRLHTGAKPRRPECTTTLQRGSPAHSSPGSRPSPTITTSSSGPRAARSGGSVLPRCARPARVGTTTLQRVGEVA